MALLQVRNGVSTLLTLEVWLLSAIICTIPLSVGAFFSSPDNKPGPDPRIKIVLHPPENVIIPINGFVFLHCTANYSAVQLSDEDYIEDDYLPYLMGDEAALIEQNDEPVKEIDDSSMINDDNGCESDVLYRWLRNGQPIDKKNDTNFQFFCNGTIKITHSTMATAIYRCSARTRQPEIGIVLSKSSNVQAAVFEKRSSKFESNAELDSSIVINCPVDSVPKMDVTWSLEKNGSHINFAQAERYFQLNNGSLLIVNVKHEDGKVFRCEAKNKYLKLPRIVRHTLHIVNGKATKSTFLPKLQNDVILIPNGNPLRLYCATTAGNSIQWTFTPRNRSTKAIPLIVHKPNELKIDSTTVHEHDGIYKCASDTEYQSFDVTIATPPVLLNGFTSKEESLGYYVSFNCNVTGNPKPTIEWYRNGELIHDDWIVNYKEPKLLIQTFEEKHKGIYQCVAKNPMGEVQATGLLSLKQKTYTDPPKNVKCFPISLTSFKVTFEGPEHFKWSGITYYTSSRNEPKWMSAILHDANKRIQNEFTVKNFKRYPFVPFMLFFRGMESTGSDVKQKGGIISFQFELSRLSEGVKCATQGWPVYGIFSQDGIFVWWPQVDHINVTSYLVQFQSDDPINFTEHVIGTTKEIDEFHTWTDVAGHLTTISAITNVQREMNGSSNKTKSGTTSPKLITELRIDGNVTGVLIPNTVEVIVRLLVPVIDEDGELIQDARFVEWKKIRDTPGRQTKFQFVNKGTHHVTFGSTDPRIRCVRICYRGMNNVCGKKQIDNQLVEVDSLAPSTSYKFILSECSNLKTHYNEFVVQTLHDIPGAVTNHKIFKRDGVIVEWSAPVNPNGHLEYYLIEWTIANQTYSDRISVKSGTDKNAFKFPNLPDDVRFNVTIRAVSNFGAGNPIYINFKNVAEIPDGNTVEMYAERHDPRLGITIGAILSLLCIIVCMLIIVRHRKCMKSPQHNAHNANGCVGRNSFQNRSGNDRSGNATTIITTSSTLITANCTLDGQEMQTLILTTSMENIKAINGNGIKKDFEHLTNGVVALRSNGENDFTNQNQYSDDEDNDDQDMSRCGLISSTPKSVHKAVILRNSSSNDLDVDTDDVKNTITRISVYSVQEDIEVLHSDQSPLKSMLKTTKSRNNSSHSIDRIKDRMSPTIQRMGDIIKTKYQSRSQQNLLQKARASGSSASTSSGLNIDTSSNSTSTPLDHRQSQLYLFDEKYLNNDHKISDNELMDESSVIFELKGKNGIRKISVPASDEISIDINDENHCPKRMQPKWDYRRPIVGPNG